MLILLGASTLLAACGSSRSDRLPVAEQRKLIDHYCVECHSAAKQAGGLTLEKADLAHVARDAQTWEKVIRQLRAGVMPPPGELRPNFATTKKLRVSLEAAIDETAERVAGPRSLQRLSREEYVRAVHDLLDLDIDADAVLPPDTLTAGFDDIANAQSSSPAVMEGYLRAADRVVSLALGDPDAPTTSATYTVQSTTSQMRQVDGAPFGTRGGVSVVPNFPADGEYEFTVRLRAGPNGGAVGRHAPDEQIEISINGERVALLAVDPRLSESRGGGLELQTPRIFVKAGPQRVSAVFLQRFSGLVDDLFAPTENPLAAAIGPLELFELPQLQHLNMKGPLDATGVSDTPSRRRVFSCRPVNIEEQWACARAIVSDLAERAYRRPVSDDDVQALLNVYDTARSAGFEAGIRTAVRAILASPEFVFRIERRPASTQDAESYPLGDFELASRLSFFLWSSVPDQELLDSARDGRLHEEGEIERQVERMLADPRSEALSTRFAAQWLRLAKLDALAPDARLYPNYDGTLAGALRRETELLFDSIVRDDSNVLDLLTADYTFVNERLAAYYGMPGVLGNRFRRVLIADDHRRGLLGQGSILAMTSHADRTSPVSRGTWMLEVLLGTPPLAPPPNVPALEKTDAIKDGRVLSVRERLESHRAEPACVSCHKLIDPLGLALENYDVTGAWRIRDSGVPIDARVQLFDGTTVTGPDDLRAALLRYSDAFIASFTENLMTYALGRKLDMPTIRDIDAQAAEQGNKFSAFVLGIVESVPFQVSQGNAIAAER
jgi:hypothetical protein